MKKWISGVLVSLAAVCLVGCNGTASHEPVEHTTSVEQSVLDIDGYAIDGLSASIAPGDGYHVYSEQSGYTDEMCRMQGIDSKEKMDLYMGFTEYDMFILPENDSFLEPSYMLTVKVKEDGHGIENLKDLSATEFDQVASALLAGFSVYDGYSVYENDTAKYIVFDWTAVTQERRYATVLEGKMVYFIAQTDDTTTPERQDMRSREIIDTLTFY